MQNTIQQTNKTLVIEAFDTLFNKRDYAAAERYWSPHYIQHSAHISPGRDGLLNLIKIQVAGSIMLKKHGSPRNTVLGQSKARR
jgi:hypothetical protein